MKTMTRKRWEQIKGDAEPQSHWLRMLIDELLSCIEPVEGERGDEIITMERKLLRLLGYPVYDTKMKKPHIYCPECGPFVESDQDGCCVTCGATTRLIEVYSESASEMCKKTHVQNCHECDDKACGDNLGRKDAP